MSAYTDFLAAKAQLANSGGFEPDDLSVGSTGDDRT